MARAGALRAWVARQRAWRRHRNGLYDDHTAALFSEAVQLFPSRENVLAQAIFSREQGHSPQGETAAILLRSLTRFRGDELQQAVHLLLEAGHQQEVLHAVIHERLLDFADNSPAITAILQEHESDSDLRKLFQDNKKNFLDLGELILKERASLCVVGPSINLRDSKLGATIDDHALVTRFELPQKNEAPDIGSKFDILVRTPNFKRDPLVEIAGSLINTIAPPPTAQSCQNDTLKGKTQPAGESANNASAPTDSTQQLNNSQAANNNTSAPPVPWLVLTGPDPRYRLAQWDPILELQEAGSRALTLPLSLWQSLVKKLQAPPSPSVLYLAWLIELLGSPKDITIAGFDLSTHSPAERALLKSWKSQGMTQLQN